MAAVKTRNCFSSTLIVLMVGWYNTVERTMANEQAAFLVFAECRDRLNGVKTEPSSQHFLLSSLSAEHVGVPCCGTIDYYPLIFNHYFLHQVK